MLYSTTSVSYKCVGSKNKVLYEREQAACYSGITYYAVQRGTKYILCHHHFEWTPYSDEIWARWIEEVNTFGFRCKYLGRGHAGTGIPKEHHVIKIQLVRGTKEYYQHKAYLTSALMLVRYLMESGLNKLPKVYFELKDLFKDKDVDPFYLMQMAHWYITGNFNHSLRDNHVTKFITRETIKERFNGAVHSIYGCTYPTIDHLWRGDVIYLYGSAPQTAEDKWEMYQKCLPKKQEMNIYVVGGANHYANWIPNAKIVDSLEKAELVLFTGGEDVTPDFYGEPAHPQTGNNIYRDKLEKEIYDKAKALNLKTLGICRGSQFMCVMAGGKLVQHQEAQPAVHAITMAGYPNIELTSTHHQAQYPFNLGPGKYRIIGYTQGLSRYHQNGLQQEMNPPRECEIVYYRAANSLGIQGHPEFQDYKDNPKYANSLATLQTLVQDFVNNKL